MLYPRHLQPIVLRSLRDTPVVLLKGARQTGKTTLVRRIVADDPRYRYVSLDDAATLAAAQADPAGFIEDLEERVAIDEVQKAPALFPAIKVVVDRRRRAGSFLLTGSADILMMPSLSESLAGRMEPKSLWPLSQGEIGATEERFIASVFGGRLPRHVGSSDHSDLLNRALRGGFPAAFRRPEARRRDWMAAYLTTIVQRDVRDLAEIQHVALLPRVLSLLAARAGGLLNVSELSRSAGIPLSTLQRYLVLLEETFLVRLIPAWSTSRSKRLIRSPKVALVDSGLLAHLAGISSGRLRREPDLAGPLLENLVATELWKQVGWSRVRAQLFHFRTHGGREVDVVLEADDGRVVGLEVKASSNVQARDFAGLHALHEASGNRFHRGVVLYGGTESLSFGGRMHALPISALWETSA